MAKRESIPSPDEIRKVREGRKMTQAEFAELIGVSRHTVLFWEQGTRQPSLSRAKLIRLAKQRKI